MNVTAIVIAILIGLALDLGLILIVKYKFKVLKSKKELYWALIRPYRYLGFGILFLCVIVANFIIV